MNGKNELDRIRSQIIKEDRLVRGMFATLITTSESNRYDSARSLLEVSERMSATIAALESALENLPDIHFDNPCEVSMPSEEHEKTTSEDISKIDQFPVFFVKDDNLLFKIGQKEKPDDKGKYWWKSVDLAEALKIMDEIIKQGNESFRQKDIASAFSIPDYRIDIVVSALKKTGFLNSARRGYYRIQKGTPFEWIEALKQLPERSDLMLSKTK